MDEWLLDPIQIRCILSELGENSTYSVGLTAIAEAQNTRTKKMLKPRLEVIYAQLCGIRIEKGETAWYSALDASIDFLTNLLYKEDK